MNEWNVGVDVVDIARFRRSDYLSNKRFYERIFTTREIQHCLSFRDSASHFAANFAAKEAVYKALSGFYEAKLNEIEVFRDKAGAPCINLLNKGVNKRISSRQNPPFEIKVSLSHSASYAVAFAVAICSQRAIRNFKLSIEKCALT